MSDSIDTLLRDNIRALMRLHRWNQTDFAERLRRSQGWVSKHLNGQLRFQVCDLDGLSTVFGLSPAELLRERYGKWDRRSGLDRRSGTERRRTPREGLRAFPQREMEEDRLRLMGEE
jgi:transcriptional regulator with XRE-family HTH domain